MAKFSSFSSALWMASDGPILKAGCSYESDFLTCMMMMINVALKLQTPGETG